MSAVVSRVQSKLATRDRSGEKRPRRSVAEWSDIVLESYRDGPRATAIRHGIARSQIYYWRVRVGNIGATQSEENEVPAFTQVRVEELKPAVAGTAVMKEVAADEPPVSAGIKLELGAIRLSLPVTMGLQQIAELVLLLEAGQ
ncbi:hypothetical protein ACQU0X_29260 [Pseudovibrio ascidiaceicola]|uniref:hypothetical protein n=1 Tax=Pseudovibrio ascidiaceicola TaxID=285279 RepID=UPI003D366250